MGITTWAGSGGERALLRAAPGLLDSRQSGVIRVRVRNMEMPIPTLGSWPGLGLPRGPALCPTLQISCLLRTVTAPLPPPPVPAVPTVWPCHFPKRIRCQGKLAALRGKRVQADLILGPLLSPGSEKGVESGPGGAGGVPALSAPLWLLHCPVHVVGGETDRDQIISLLPVPHPHPTPPPVQPE